ncbi:hypothetical protein T492DRAFT_441283 [Pavlovales sp. CCMP2436]|nr:hypothetical protein T492DRAFT_441283 [Pavlovales sp. CCMP2436]
MGSSSPPSVHRPGSPSAPALTRLNTALCARPGSSPPSSSHSAGQTAPPLMGCPARDPSLLPCTPLRFPCDRGKHGPSWPSSGSPLRAPPCSAGWAAGLGRPSLQCPLRRPHRAHPHGASIMWPILAATWPPRTPLRFPCD